MRKTLNAIFGAMILLFLFASTGMAQRHHLNYTAAHFSGDSSDNFLRTGDDIANLGTGMAWFDGAVNFPDSANGMQVTRLSCTLVDNSATGYLQVQLYKVDRWSGLSTLVGYLTTSAAFTSSSVIYLNIPKSQMNARGIDNNRWAWYLTAYFSEGNTVMGLSHVTISYE
jgi:hypothetical protein